MPSKEWSWMGRDTWDRDCGQLRRDGEEKVGAFAGLHMCDVHRRCVTRSYLTDEGLGSLGHFWGTIIPA